MREKMFSDVNEEEKAKMELIKQVDERHKALFIEFKRGFGEMEVKKCNEILKEFIELQIKKNGD